MIRRRSMLRIAPMLRNATTAWLPEQLRRDSAAMRVEEVKDDAPSLEVDTVESMQKDADEAGRAAERADAEKDAPKK